MRIAVSGDWHLEAGLGNGVMGADGVSSRFRDHEALLWGIFTKAAAESCDAFVFLGDLARTRTPSPSVYRTVVQLAENATFHTHWLVGNHDLPTAPGRAHSLCVLDPAAEGVYATPQVTSFAMQALGRGKCIWLPALAPWHPVPVREVLAGLYEQAGPGALVFAHAPVIGAQLPSGAEATHELFGSRALTLEDLLAGKPRGVFLGDIHKYQVLCEDPPVMYTGSPYRVDWSEAEDPKGFLILDL